MGFEIPRKEIPLAAVAMSLDDARKIFERLLKYVLEQGTLEVSKVKKLDGQTVDGGRHLVVGVEKRANGSHSSPHRPGGSG